MKKTLILSTFLFLNSSIIIAFSSLFLINSVYNKTSDDQFLPESANSLTAQYASYSAIPQAAPVISVEIVGEDARASLIDNFFTHYKSPMIGLGKVIVEKSDKYNLPFGLLPAIAQCEGNLGKVMPSGSFNTWGWAIYGDKVTRFNSWEEAIEKVSKGLRQNYFDKGFNTPQRIMKRYTPSSTGSWADCVSQFLEELR